MAACGCTAQEAHDAAPLVKWKGNDLIVSLYPGDKVKEVQGKRETAKENGKKGGRPKKETNGKPTLVSENNQDGFKKEPTAKAERKGKEVEREVEVEKECEVAHAPKTAPSEVEFSQTGAPALAAKIVSEYPKPGGNHSTAEYAVVLAIEAGEDPVWIRTCVNIHAARYKALPPEERRYCPSRENYFVQKRWADDPDGPTWVHYPKGKQALSTMENFTVISHDL